MEKFLANQSDAPKKDGAEILDRNRNPAHLEKFTSVVDRISERLTPNEREHKWEGRGRGQTRPPGSRPGLPGTQTGTGFEI